jgi:adenosylhomocysteine nucleosidase
MVAMEAEYELIRRLLEQGEEKKIAGTVFLEGSVGGKTVVAARSGIGKVCAAAAAVELIRNFAPDCLINTGVAGGIDRSLQVMDVVAGREVVYHDVWCGEGNLPGQVQGFPPVYTGDPGLYRQAMELPGRLKGGLICSGDRFITDRSELEQIKATFPEGLAVDMESGAIAQVCYLYSVPFLSFRVISDTPGVENHAEQYKNFWQQAPGATFEIVRTLLTRLSLD